ncbi:MULTISPECIES: FtsX-like permease family protein [unclassified Microbacterium]|uniref:FtsX-like permease family protein n=1 Tax=unclassified Microbacterium TaxID=2609290 RepID=UPI00214C4F78|nr:MULTISPECIES: FtsX-like permease family protein [unclassified Microbacterium]MCR2783654.1 permease [Microbacterium sp. zg.B96]WIM15488.1 permease [Microbacterium sp. zg-B96]
MSVIAASVLTPPTARSSGSLRRVATLTALLARPSRQGRAALVLPVVAFAVTTALLLVVVGGTIMFHTDPRTNGDVLYGMLATLALVLLAVPVFTLGAAAARLSSRRRNDRLATLRLLGATTSEVSMMTVLEAATTAFVGAIGGVVLYLLLLPLVGLLPFFGGPIGIGAVWAGVPAVAAAVFGVTALATTSAALSLRKVRLTPLGVRRRTNAAPKRLALIVICLLLLVVVIAVVANIGLVFDVIGVAVLMGLFAGAMGLVNVIGTPIVAARGRSLARRASSAAQLIAGRELAAHAGQAWRRVSGIAMIAFIAVVAGAGMGLLETIGENEQGTVLADIRTGVIVTLAAAFVLLACSVGVTQAASVLEDRELIVGLDRLGVPEDELRRARRTGVMLPLRWAAVGGAAVGGALSLPMVGSALVTSPVPTLVVAATFAGGFAVVGLALSATDPLTRAVRRSGV